MPPRSALLAPDHMQLEHESFIFGTALQRGHAWFCQLLETRTWEKNGIWSHFPPKGTLPHPSLCFPAVLMARVPQCHWGHG